MKDTAYWMEFRDNEWPLTYIDHDRLIARAIVVDDDDNFYFVHADRDDAFGRSLIIETSGGGVEPGEDPDTAIHRELQEELGADTEILAKIGVISDYYNLVHRHNINHYYLCRVLSFGEKHLTKDEIDHFHLSTLKMSYEEAVNEYVRCCDSRLGRLIGRRELPVLLKAGEILKKLRSTGRAGDEKQSASRRKPRIAVASYILPGPEKGRPSPTYLDAIYKTGGLGFLTGPVLTEADAEQIYQEYDGLVLSGGADINAEFLNEAPHEKALFSSRERDLTEILLAKRFMAGSKPILAICRGAQILNAAMGGTHDQHIFDRPEVTIAHQNGETRHPVKVLADTFLASLFPGQETLTVNSTHHQAVKELASGFELNAMSPDGVIEAYAGGSRVLGVQWHPERLLEEGMRPIFEWLIKACKCVEGT